MKLLIPVLILTLSSTLLAQVGKSEGVQNPNRATKEQLVELPHITADLADAIIASRPFLSMEALDAVLSKTLDSEKRGELYVKLFLPINLNTASRSEIMLVPGIGKRMAHEFEEYRPYKKLDQFRREMGKYVDKKEVARFEQYVFVPLDLNSASEEDLKTIPGVGRRMTHEFLEYRPYKDMKQFRREIGKYVDSKEVARLERYVFIGEGKKAEKVEKVDL